MEPIRRTPNRQQRVACMTDFLAQQRSSGSIHFWKALRKSALHRPPVRQNAKLSVPKKFVQDHRKKVREFVTVRVRTSNGRSSRSWSAHCCVDATLKVTIVGGWPNFSFHNRLKKGDFVVFVLRDDARSEFEVHEFRGPNRLRYLPDRQEEHPDELVEEPEEKEDNKVNQMVAQRLLNILGCSVDVACDGVEAINILERSDAYDIIFLDCHMPIMDGVETARLVRQKSCISHAIPIVALTAATSEGKVDKCIASGMDDYISKPVTKGTLHCSLEKWVGKESRWVDMYSTL